MCKMWRNVVEIICNVMGTARCRVSLKVRVRAVVSVRISIMICIYIHICKFSICIFTSTLYLQPENLN